MPATSWFCGKKRVRLVAPVPVKVNGPLAGEETPLRRLTFSRESFTISLLNE